MRGWRAARSTVETGYRCALVPAGSLFDSLSALFSSPPLSFAYYSGERTARASALSLFPREYHSPSLSILDGEIPRSPRAASHREPLSSFPDAARSGSAERMHPLLNVFLFFFRFFFKLLFFCRCFVFLLHLPAPSCFPEFPCLRLPRRLFAL